MSKEIRIGCSGYYYPYWKNKFYPEGLAPGNWLQYYSSVFNTVELNGTFYRTPKLSDLKKYVENTPDDFTFSVKINKAITHLAKLKESKQSIADFQNLIKEGLGNKLNCFLFQMPPSFHYNEENLERIIENIPHQVSNVVELRHVSWWNAGVEQVFKKAGLTFCNVDYPGLKSYFIHTTPVFYLRMHGSPQLFKSAYTFNDLEKVVEQIPASCKYCMVYFNNTYYEAGYTNALQLKQLLQNA